MNHAIKCIGGTYQCFSTYKRNLSQEHIDKLWAQCDYTECWTDTHYEGFKSKGICTFDFGDTKKIGNFILGQIITGNWIKENDFNPMKYTLGCEVSDKDNKKIIIISGYKFDDLITRFLNKLAQYENLNDYLEAEELGNNDQWELQNVTDRICNLAKVIELYKKYKLINPALAIVRDMETLIEERLKQLMR